MSCERDDLSSLYWGGAVVTTTMMVATNEAADTYRTPFGYKSVWKIDGEDPRGVKGKAGQSRTFPRTDTPPPRKVQSKRKYRRAS